jgi:hypothetical protein
LTLRAHLVSVDTQPPAHLSAAHLHRASLGRRDQSLAACRVDAHEDAALTARRDRHVPVYEKRETAEHLLLGDLALVVDEFANAVRKVIVECHATVSLERAAVITDVAVARMVRQNIMKPLILRRSEE